MANLNKVILVGNFVRDVEVQHTKSGLAYTRYTVAIDRPMNRDGKRGVDFSSCVAFGKMAENLGKLGRKGTLVYVDGHVRSSSFTDKNGNRRSSMNIATNSFEILTPRDGGSTSQGNYASGQSAHNDYHTNTNYQNNNSYNDNNSYNQSAPQAQGAPTNNTANDQGSDNGQAKRELEKNSDKVDLSDDQLPF